MGSAPPRVRGRGLGGGWGGRGCHGPRKAGTFSALFSLGVGWREVRAFKYPPHAHNQPSHHTPSFPCEVPTLKSRNGEAPPLSERRVRRKTHPPPSNSSPGSSQLGKKDAPSTQQLQPRELSAGKVEAGLQPSSPRTHQETFDKLLNSQASFLSSKIQ